MRSLPLLLTIYLCFNACLHSTVVDGQPCSKNESSQSETKKHNEYPYDYDENMLQKFDSGFYCDTLRFPIDSLKKRNLLVRSIEELVHMKKAWNYSHFPKDYPEEDLERIKKRDSLTLKKILSSVKYLNMKILKGIVVIKKVDTMTCVINSGKGSAIDIFANHIYVENIHRPQLRRYDSLTDLSWEDEVYYNWDRNEIAKLVKEERMWDDWQRLTEGMRIKLMNDSTSTIEFFDDFLVEKEYKIKATE